MTDEMSWIADVDGVKACVPAADLGQWTHVDGWSKTTEPVGQERQWVRHEGHGGRGVLNHEAALLHEGLGWFPSDPPPPPGRLEPPPVDLPATPAPPAFDSPFAGETTPGQEHVNG